MIAAMRWAGPLCAIALGCAVGPLGCAPDRCADQTPGTVCAIAGTGELGFNQDGKSPHDTDFYLVSRSRRGPDGLLYFMDFNNWRLRRLGSDGLIETVAGNGVHGFALPGLAAAESPLDNPIDFDFLSDGRLIMVSYDDPRVLIIEDDGKLSVLAGTGNLGTIGDEGDGGRPIQASFIQLNGLALAPDGAMYVSDSIAHRVRVIRDDRITTFAGTGEAGFSGDGGPAPAAMLHLPTALELDAAGNLYVADALNHVVRRISVDGQIETVAGTGENGLSGDGGPATEAQLAEPDGLAVGADGTLYIADRANFRIRRVDPDGTIDTIAGTDEGWSGDGGAALDAQFGFLARISFDGPSLLVADQSNGCIRRVFLPEQ